MLNEQAEYEEYTKELTEETGQGRLKARLLQNGFSGKTRAEEIVGRHFYCEEFQGIKDWRERLWYTIAILKLYSGDISEEDEEDEEDKRMYRELRNRFPGIVDWLGNYAGKVIRGYKCDSVYHTSGNRIENENNQFWNRPLQRYYLCGRADPEKLMEEIMCGTTRKGAIGGLQCLADESDKMQPKHWDRILKLTAAYLLAGGERDDGYRVVNETDLLNWTGPSPSGVDRMDRLGPFYYKGEPLYENRREALGLGKSEGRANVAMLRLNEKWMRDCEWQIVEEHDLEKILSEGREIHFWADLGSRYHLVEGRSYQEISAGAKQ